MHFSLLPSLKGPQFVRGQLQDITRNSSYRKRTENSSLVILFVGSGRGKKRIPIWCYNLKVNCLHRSSSLSFICALVSSLFLSLLIEILYCSFRLKIKKKNVWSQLESSVYYCVRKTLSFYFFLFFDWNSTQGIFNFVSQLSNYLGSIPAWGNAWAFGSIWGKNSKKRNMKKRKWKRK